MLAYLEALCSALKARDAIAIGSLLRHPLASALPSLVLDEAQRIAAAPPGSESIAPIQALRLYHQTAHLLGACTDPATRRRGTPAGRHVMAAIPSAERSRQIELELPVHAAVA